ncbi:MAG: helix-turn-helix domain-containing protein [Fusicatenibacter sp.]
MSTTHPDLSKNGNSSRRNPVLSYRGNEHSFCSQLEPDCPFEVTFEYCSGTQKDDYINVISLGPGKSWFEQETYAHHHRLFSGNLSHSHDYFELILVLDGSITQRIEDKTYLYAEGDCCLINRSLCHYEDFNSSAALLFIGFSVETVRRLFAFSKQAYFPEEQSILSSELYHFLETDLRLPGQKACLDFFPARSNRSYIRQLHLFANRLFSLLFAPAFGTTFQINGMFCSLLHELSSPASYHCSCMELTSASDFLLFSRIRHLMEESDGRLSRRELEKLLHYSGDYLNRITHKYAGMCLFDYGMTFCMQKAAKELLSTDSSAAEIADRLHFHNRSHFYALFKKTYGMTPGQYRKQARLKEKDGTF